MGLGKQLSLEGHVRGTFGRKIQRVWVLSLVAASTLSTTNMGMAVESALVYAHA